MIKKVTRREAISKYLNAVTHKDIAELYTPEMEVQVNVAKDHGEPITGEFRGKTFKGYTDGLTQWKSFRIPYNANSDPQYEDTPMSFDLEEHAEAIGLTGWNWDQRRSIYVAFDFDSLIGHTSGLTDNELQKVKNIASELDYVQIRKSTSGKGLHLYVFIDDDVEVHNHNEHAAIARSILSKICADTGYDFASKVDICGGNMWVWHRKMLGTDGLKLVKQFKTKIRIPVNWQDHLDVITKKRHKIRPTFIPEENRGEQDDFEALLGQANRIPLDNTHKALFKYLEENNAQFWWDNDHYMLVCHTYDLKKAHAALNLRGIFDTVSSGKERGADHNCFAFPLSNGAWSVRRYTRGIKETPNWDQDSSGWTRTYFNREPDLIIASRAHEGIENEKGGFIFDSASVAIEAAADLGIHIKIPNWLLHRECTFLEHKDGRLIIKIVSENSDNGEGMRNLGWQATKDKMWTKIYSKKVSVSNDIDVGNYDNLVRHLVTESGVDFDWVIKVNNKWIREPRQHITLALKSLGIKASKVEKILGNCVMNSWTIVNRPFQSEYLGNRTWNMNSVQLRFLPKTDTHDLHYPTWVKILTHCGQSLNNDVSKNEWCVENDILTGYDYLKCWCASLFQQPLQPLPYLFFFGDQNSGKSIFHEALGLLMTHSGYVRAENALTSSSGFNGELETGILCVVEELDLEKNKTAYNRIKDWVTSVMLPIHKKMMTPFNIPNSTHWVQCSNDSSSCPVFPGDTRITMIHVPPIETPVSKRKLMPLLQEEARDFITELLNLELPECEDRLNIPVLETTAKSTVQNSNKTDVEAFIDECCYRIPGAITTINDFYLAFQDWLDPQEFIKWSKIKVSKYISKIHGIPKGRNPKDAQWCYGNISLSPNVEPSKKLVCSEQFLREED
jgi:hypothetical protein